MLKNLKLSNKFNLILVAIFVCTVLLSGLAFSTLLNYTTEREVVTRAALLLKTLLSVRQYTLLQIAPELNPRLETDRQFLPQTVPNYSAREVVEYLRADPDYKDFFYKEATLNPTNLRDKADEFETQIVEQFRSDRQLQELTGYRQFPGRNLFYIARPIAVTEQDCLRCHSIPEAAPASQIATYGRENGFGWQLNEIIGAQVISVPTTGLIDSARRSSMLFVGLLALMFAVALLIINLLLKRVIIHPLNRISRVANEVSMGNLEAEFTQESNDEIGKLAASFNRMKTSLLVAINILKQSN
ncbi:MAG: DUF3365 domain-containing protein [Cyanobacteria bacterium CRU_2_1]|nr:DUF3365 domain-containing protein [Cyanobacteria bacterium RU_5_0]NJR62599.1 DUF3365 domain-containing protein [Cyanobacteria bacterium CRU_2_1]